MYFLHGTDLCRAPRQIFKKLLNPLLLLLIRTCDNSSKRASLKVSLKKIFLFSITYNFRLKFTESSFHYSDHYFMKVRHPCFNYVKALKIFWAI